MNLLKFVICGESIVEDAAESLGSEYKENQQEVFAKLVHLMLK